MNQADTIMDNKRKETRMRRLKEARIIFNERRSVMSCIVRDASSCGARVTVGEPYLVPHEFSFAAPGAPERQARKIWIRQNEMGLQFLS
jgi:hypothetical protein